MILLIPKDLHYDEVGDTFRAATHALSTSCREDTKVLSRSFGSKAITQFNGLTHHRKLHVLFNGRK